MQERWSEVNAGVLVLQVLEGISIEESIVHSAGNIVARQYVLRLKTFPESMMAADAQITFSEVCFTAATISHPHTIVSREGGRESNQHHTAVDIPIQIQQVLPFIYPGQHVCQVA